MAVDAYDLPVGLGDVLGGRLRMERLLGTGGFGGVFAACHLRTGQQVAVKVLSRRRMTPDLRLRFQQEARALGQINHPHVVALLDADEDGGVQFFTMELLRGESIEERLGRGAMPPLEVAKVLAQAASALGAAHDLGIVHRDLKPANVFLADVAGAAEPQVKILDFGIAKLAPDAGSLLRTGTLQVLGTPHFIAPEQFDGNRTIDGRADVFSLGVTAWQALVGRRPFEGLSREQALARILTVGTPPVRSERRDVPMGLAGIVDWMIRRDPDERPASMAQVEQAVERWRRGEVLPELPIAPTERLDVASVSPPAPPVQAEPPARRPAWSAAVVSAAAVLAGGLALAAVGLGVFAAKDEPERTGAVESTPPEPAPRVANPPPQASGELEPEPSFEGSASEREDARGVEDRRTTAQAPREAAPGLERPGQPGLERPGQPGLERPGQPGLERPGQPGLERPGQPGLERPGQPGLERPGQPGLERPGQPGLERPGQPGLERPGQPDVVRRTVARAPEPAAELRSAEAPLEEAPSEAAPGASGSTPLSLF